MPRVIFHLEVPNFAVSVERVRYRSLATRPLIIAPPGNARARVLSLSSEVRDCGAVTGMRLSAALQLCPSATVLPPDRLLYGRAATAAGKILGEFTPVSEYVSNGRFFLDMTGTSRLFGPSRDSASKILREIDQRIRLNARAGIAINKSVSKVASSVVPSDLLDVIPGCEMSFLSPWEVRRLPGTEQIRDVGLFEDLCIHRIGELAGYAVGHLSMVFGKMGPVLHQRARGVDPRPVLPPDKRPVVREQEVLAQDTNSRDRLLAHLFALTERSGYRLRTLNSVPRTVTLGIGYSDNLSAQGHARISPPSFDDGSLFAVVRKLFARVANRRVRACHLALTFSGLSPLAPQLSLFADRTRSRREQSLTNAMDAIRDRFGVKSLSRGVAA